MAGKKVLMVLNEEPYPINSGGRMRTKNFIEALSDDGWDISIFHKISSPDGLKVEQYGKSFRHVWPCDEFPLTARSGHDGAGRSVFSKARDLLSGVPWEIYQYTGNDFSKKLMEVIEQNSFDYIFCRYIYSARYILELRSRIKAKVVVDIDDIEPVRMERRINTDQSLGRYQRFRLLLNNRFFADYHKNLKKVESCLVCSEKDKELVERSGWSSKVHVVPNTVDVRRYDGVPQLTENIWAGKVILCCGHLGYAPNVDGLKWFIEKAWPIIKERVPGVKLHMVGKDPDPSLSKYLDGRSIFLFPNVPDVAPYYRDASLAIVPLHVGGGTRIKVLEAFACRRPIVSTTIGVEGLDLANSRECLLADDPEVFANQCCSLLTSIDLTLDLAARARVLVEEKYDTLQVRKLIKHLFVHR